MPNTGHYTLCPYFVGEKEKSIHCEDAFRRFKWPSQKYAWMKNLCDASWQDCPYAKELTRIYQSIEKGEKDMGELNRHSVSELEKENKKLAAKVGKLERDIAEKNDAIEKQRKKIRAHEEHYNALNRRFKDEVKAHNETKKNAKDGENQFFEEIKAIVEENTERVNKICGYLMAQADTKELRESDIDAWKQENDMIIVTKRDNNGRYWVLVPREEYVKNVK